MGGYTNPHPAPAVFTPPGRAPWAGGSVFGSPNSFHLPAASWAVAAGGHGGNTAWSWLRRQLCGLGQLTSPL